MRGDWVLPCDLVLLRGTCVADESALTGEAMPVQKTPAPRDGALPYRADKGGAKHTLFAGTKVLQTKIAGDQVGRTPPVITGAKIDRAPPPETTSWGQALGRSQSSHRFSA